MNIREEITNKLKENLEDNDVEVTLPFADDMVLLESGLDSLGFAILVTRLEIALGYDPFTLMDEAVYPSTFIEFVQIYEKYKPVDL